VTRPSQTQASFLAELPALLHERSMSAHALARLAGINHSHLSRAKRGKDYKTLSGELVARLGRALELPAGYFPEEREAVVIERIRSDPDLRDELYRHLTPKHFDS
jgi:transcriptional regulator with XRE-family HTH domain